MQVLGRYPDLAMVCSYSACTLTGVRGMQVLCRYPDPYHGYVGTLTGVRDMQVICRYSDPCQENVGTLQVL